MLYYVMVATPTGDGASCHTRLGRMFKKDSAAIRLAERRNGWVEATGYGVWWTKKTGRKFGSPE